jgi:hypothetical protein
MVQPLEIRPTSALRHEPATRRETGEQTAEQPSMIADPVEGCGAEDHVSRPSNGQMGGITEDQVDPITKSRTQKIACDPEHVFGEVDCDHPTPRQTLEQLLSKPSGAASYIEHQLVSLERKPFEHRSPPIELRG